MAELPSKVSFVQQGPGLFILILLIFIISHCLLSLWQVLDKPYDLLIKQVPFTSVKALLHSSHPDRYLLAKSFIRANSLADNEVENACIGWREGGIKGGGKREGGIKRGWEGGIYWYKGRWREREINREREGMPSWLLPPVQRFHQSKQSGRQWGRECLHWMKGGRN